MSTLLVWLLITRVHQVGPFVDLASCERARDAFYLVNRGSKRESAVCVQVSIPGAQ